MKYRQYGKKINTSCQDCIFALYEESTQTGCEFDKLKEYDLIEAYNENGNFYVLDGLCNLLRHKDWNGGEKDISKLMSEICFDFFVIIDGFALDSMSLKKVNVEYQHKDKFLFHIIGPPSKQKDLLKLRKRLGCKATISPYSSYVKHKVLSNTKYSYFTLIDNPKAVNLNLSDFNDKYCKVKTKPTHLEFNGLEYTSCLLYHLVSYNNGEILFDKNMDEIKKYAKSSDQEKETENKNN